MTEPNAPTPGAAPAPPAQPVYQPPPPQPAATDPRRKSAFLACVFSAVPGLGQIYVGYYQRGFIHILVAATIITLIANSVAEPLIPLLGLFLGFFWLYNMIDAYRRASLYNQALAGQGGDIELPADLKVPGFRGTIAGGATLAVIGFILLLNTRFNVSLEWVEDWWPAAFIIFGGYLIWKALKERADGDSYGG